MKRKHIILMVIALVMSLGVLVAQEATATAAPVTEAAAKTGGVDLIEIYNTSGFMAWPILGVFLLGLAYAVLKYIQLGVREKFDAPPFYLRLKNFVKNEQIDEAIKITEQFKGTTMGFIFWMGLKGYYDVRKAGKKGDDARLGVRDAFEEAALQKVHKLEGGLFWFDTAAQIATYLGLLGTIFGLIDAFNGLAGLTGAAANNALTNGIYKAIGTTALGLMAAIPFTVIKGALLTKAQHITSQIDEYSVKLVNYINNYLIKD